MSWQRTLAATAHITMHPAQLVGKQRPMTDYRNHRTYTPTKTLKAEKAIKDAFRAAYGETFADHDGPVVMRISTTRPLAKSNPKYWEGRADLGKPDWDNLGKLACDALNGIAFKDDSQVDTGAVTKRPRSPYGTQPRIDIYIEYFVEEYVKEKKRTPNTSKRTALRTSTGPSSTKQCSTTPPASRTTSCSTPRILTTTTARRRQTPTT